MTVENLRLVPQSKGFTLVELLIVMSIVGTLLSLVGPLAIDSLSKAQARSEILTLKNWINFQSQRAFIAGSDIELNLVGKAVEISINGIAQPTKEFDYLFFQPQIVRLTKHGFIQPDIIQATIVDKEITIELNTRNESEIK